MNESDLNNFTGTEEYYQYGPECLLTDGTKFLAEEAQSYWLLDLIRSYQPQLLRHKDSRLHNMQFWTLTVDLEKKSAVAICEADSGEQPAVRQEIPFTDFPLAEIKVWVIQQGEDQVILLPSEY